jgi:magnesium transporter
MEHLDQPVTAHMRTGVPLLTQHQTVQEAIAEIRRQATTDQILYFYVVDAEDRLVGVLPTRRLLLSAADQPLEAVMLTRVVALPESATVYDACEFFILYKLLAFPVVDANHRVLGVVDVNLFTEEMVNLSEQDQWDHLFETLGYRYEQIRKAGPLRAFRYRFPWLLTTVVSGTLCALLAGAFETTLAESLVLTFFLAMVLGLGESVSIQSMTVTIQALHVSKPTLRWYANALRKEMAAALLLGLGCCTLVGGIVWLWKQDAGAALVIGGSIFMALVVACGVGLSVPSLLHALRLDPKIAAGPLTLALTDLSTLLLYFSLARALL